MTKIPLKVVARGIVDVEGGLIQIAAARDGIIREVRVEEGQFVRQDDILLVVDDRAARVALEVLDAERTQVELAIECARVRLATAEREVDRLERLRSHAAATTKELDDARDVLRLARAELAERTAALETARRRYAQGEYERERHTVRAPVDGVVVRRLARPGDGTSTLNVTTLFWLAPARPPIVRAEIEEEWARQVAPRQSVSIFVENDTTETFAGHVVRVGRTFGPRRATVYDARERVDVRVVETIIEFEGTPPALLLGQRVFVRIDTADSNSGRTGT